MTDQPTADAVAALTEAHPLLCEVAGDRFNRRGFYGVYGYMTLDTLAGRELENALAVAQTRLRDALGPASYKPDDRQLWTRLRDAMFKIRAARHKLEGKG